MTVLDAILRRLAAVEATPPGGLTAVRISAGTASANLSALTFSNANGVSFGLNGSVITGSVAAGGGGGVALAGGGQTATSGTINFANSNGVTFGMSGSSQMTASHNGLTNIRALAGTQSNNLSVLSFANSNGISFGLNSTVMTASHNGLTSQSNQAYSGANGSATFQTLSFANSNGVSFSTGTQGLFASYTVPSTAGLLSAINLSAGTQASNLSAFTLANSNGVTFGLSNGVVTASVNAGAGGGVALAAGTQTATSGTVAFANANGVTFGMSGSNQITASVNAGGAGPTVSLYPALPHAWATSSMYTASSNTTAGGFRSTHSFYIAPLVLPNAVTFNDVGVVLSPGATSAGTGSATNRHVIGIYTKNGSTLGLVTDFGFNAVVSQSSVTAQTLSWWAGAFSGSTAASTSRISGNVSASISGSQLVRFNATSSGTSLSAGQYFIAHAAEHRVTVGTVVWKMATAWRHSVSQFTAVGFGFSNTTGPAYDPLNGLFSTNITATDLMGWSAPATIHITNITATGGTSRNQWPLVILQSATA
jgi:hypothetical protein